MTRQAIRGLLARLLVLCVTAPNFPTYLYAAEMGKKDESKKRVVVCDDTQDPFTMDPFLELTEKNHTLLQQMMEGLVRFDADARVIPALAESWERLDPLRIRFHLRKGVEFHNGEIFDAESIRFSIAKFADPAGSYPGKALVSSIERADVIDPYTVDVVTRYPDGILLRRLAGLIFAVPPKYYQEVGSAGFSKRPIGTGPFKFHEHNVGKEIILKANKRYWNKGWPKFEELVFRFVPLDGQFEALMAGKTDILMDLPGTMTLRTVDNPATMVVKKESLYTVAGHFNTSAGPLADVRVRQAINFAVNKDELIRYDLMANGQVVPSISVPGQIGHNPSLKPYSYNIARAKELLQEANVKTPIKLNVITVAFGQRVAKIIAKQLEQIGVEVDLKIFADAEIADAFKNQKWDLGIAVLPSPIAHLEFPLGLLFFSQSPYSLHKDPVFDKMLQEAVVTLDPLEQDKKFQILDKWVHDQALGIFTYQRLKTYGVNRRVKFVPYSTGMPHFVDSTLQKP